MQIFEIVTLIPKVETGKISSVACWEDKVYIGTHEGHLLLYIVELHEPSGKYLFRLEKIKELGHGKNPVLQIELMKDLIKLVTLCDGAVDVLNMLTLDSYTTIPQKNVSLVCTEKKSQLLRLCVQVKKKIHIYEYVGSFQPLKELTLPESAINMEWYNGMMCLGFKKDYQVVDSETGEMIPLFTLEKSNPLFKLVDNEFLLARNELGIFVTDKGNPTRGNILWNKAPAGLAYRSPYVVALEPGSKSLEVHNILNRSLVQTLPFPNGKELKFMADASESLMDSAENSSESQRHFMLACTSSVVYAIVSISLEQQVDFLLNSKQIADAIDLVAASVAQERPQEAQKKMQKVHRKAAILLIECGELEAAFIHFKDSDVDPREVMSYFPGMISVDSNYYDTLQEQKKPLITDIALKLYPQQKDKCVKFVDNANTQLFQYLNEIQTNDQQVSKDINTCLARLYIKLSRNVLPASSNELLLDLVKSREFHMSDIEELLRENRRYNVLAYLYKRRKEYKQALELWQKLSTGEVTDVHSDGVEGTVELLAELDITREGYNNSQYLWQYAKWVIQKDIQQGIKIFTSKVRPVPIEPKQVLDYLQQFQPLATQYYLEHIIFECDNKQPEYHARLVSLYLDTMNTLFKPNDLLQFSSKAPGTEMGLLGETRKKLLRLLKASTVLKEPVVLAQIGKLPLHEERVILHTKMNEYKTALAIFVEQIGDYTRAEEYCSEYKTKDETLTLGLLKVYLGQKKASGEHIPAKALHLLNTHATELNPAKVLPLLPIDMPLQLLNDYLQRSIRHNHHNYRTGQIVKSLAKADNLNARYKKVKNTNKVFAITSEMNCPVCLKPIGDKIFARFPNNVIVHFKCFKNQSVCPVTGQDFKKESRF